MWLDAASENSCRKFLQPYHQRIATFALISRIRNRRRNSRLASLAMAASGCRALVTGSGVWAGLRATHMTMPALAARLCSLQGVAAGGSGWRPGAGPLEAGRSWCRAAYGSNQSSVCSLPLPTLQAQHPTSGSSGQASRPAARRMQQRRRQQLPLHPRASRRRLDSLALVRPKMLRSDAQPYPQRFISAAGSSHLHYCCPCRRANGGGAAAWLPASQGVQPRPHLRQASMQ